MFELTAISLIRQCYLLSFAQVTRLEHVVKFENQRTVYADDQAAIINGYNRLMDMMDEMEAANCTEEVACNREKTTIAGRYQDDFDVKGAISASCMCFPLEIDGIGSFFIVRVGVALNSKGS